jgi:hypothetical protein
MLASPGTAGFYFAWTVLGSVGWCWVLIMFYVDMKFLDFGNKRLDYAILHIPPPADHRHRLFRCAMGCWCTGEMAGNRPQLGCGHTRPDRRNTAHQASPSLIRHEIQKVQRGESHIRSRMKFRCRDPQGMTLMTEALRHLFAAADSRRVGRMTIIVESDGDCQPVATLTSTVDQEVRTLKLSGILKKYPT